MLILYDAEGRITSTVGTYQPALKTRYDELGAAYIETREHFPGIDLFIDMYVVNGEVVPRPEFPGTLDKTTIVANGTDTATLSGLPVPCVVRLDIQTFTVEDGSLEITSDMVATYNINVEHWPFKDWAGTVEAVAS